MDVFSAIADIRRVRWSEPRATWGFVPTMGFLHEGHLSLVHRARQENDRVGVSIFVNPTQFNEPDDLATYPSDLDRDLRLLENEGVDLVWNPSQDTVYPPGYETYVEVTEVTKVLEGAARPGFFRGVATVVTKLFNVFQPNRTYFGQKDAQQAVVIRRMAADLNFPIEVIVCPTIREPDGLAMSSRNANLPPAARREATCLYHALLAAKELFEGGERDAERLRATMAGIINAVELARLDYVSVAHPDTLQEQAVVHDRALLSLAVFFNDVRLIDNMVVER
ncbi:MAG: pantoate--beta-alanine ligase [Deltaproteobacteria bacterium]|nr:MAG: pantoate--beta-alanine ligase [Deltaproteobacteria bacterium]